MTLQASSAVCPPVRGVPLPDAYPGDVLRASADLHAVAERTVAIATEAGAREAIVFTERSARFDLRVDGGVIVSARAGVDSGTSLSVRVARDRVSTVMPRSGFAEVVRADVLAAVAAAGPRLPDHVVVGMPRRSRAKDDHPRRQPARVIGARELVHAQALAEAAESGARERLDDLAHVLVGVSQVRQEVATASDDDPVRSELRLRSRLVVQVSVQRGYVQQVVNLAPGRLGALLSWRLADAREIGRDAADTALRRLNAQPCPTGMMPVVLAPAAAGLLAHEAFGHALEADAVCGDGSLFAGQFGRQLGSVGLTVVDDPTIAESWVHLATDDEGVTAAPTVLIEEGRVAGTLTDRATSASGHGNGHGRRSGYAAPALPRMSNTYIVPGSVDPDSLIADVEHGLYVVDMDAGEMAWSTQRCSFLATEAYLIENGRIGDRVWGGLIQGYGPDVLRAVDAVGDDLAWRQAMCNKHGHWVPVSYGSPTLRLGFADVTGPSL